MAEETKRISADPNFFASFQLMERYLDLIGELPNARDRKEFFKSARGVLNHLVDARCCSIYVWDEESGGWVVHSATEDSTCPGMEHESVAWSIDHCQYNIIPAGESGGSFVMVPLVVRGRSAAVVVASSPMAADQYPMVVTKLVGHFSRHLDSLYENLELSASLGHLRDLFDNIIESVPHALIAVSTTGRTLALNSNAEFMFDVKAILALDEDFNTAFPPAVAEVFSNLMIKALAGDSLIDFEFEHHIDERTALNIGISTSVLYDRQEAPTGVLFLCRDMSLSREVTKLQELDRLKTEFVNTVSHELKTPLTAIVGGVEILMVDKDELTEDQCEIVGVIEDGSKRLQTLISDLLDLSKLQSGTVQLNEREYVIADLVREAVAVQKPGTAHHVRVEIEADLPPIVVDGQKILQVLTNLVSNALKYSPGGGEVLVDARREGHDLRISVRDQGMGIKEEHLEKIWEKFYRVDSSLSSEIEGTGLGLVIVKHIVELHGGRIWAESEYGNGSEFILLLPLRVAADD